MRGSRVSAFLVLCVFVAAFVISAPMLVAEHAWDADASGSSTGVTGDPVGPTGPDSTNEGSEGMESTNSVSSGGTTVLEQVLFQLIFHVSGGGL